MELHENPGAFGGLPEAPDFDSARFAVLPVPYEGTVTWLKGTDPGPGRDPGGLGQHGVVRHRDRRRALAAGHRDHGAGGCRPRRPRPWSSASSRPPSPCIAAGKAVVGLGGEHSVTVGLMEAARRAHPGPVGAAAGRPLRHPRAATRARPTTTPASWPGCAEHCDIVQVGIRSMDAAEAGAIRALADPLRPRDRRHRRAGRGRARAAGRPGLRDHRPGRPRSVGDAVHRHARAGRPALPPGRASCCARSAAGGRWSASTWSS